ncbi:hypothetical protein CNMCM5793_002875 [Aspergillus hiratsukae]|uniref:Uncharacterized protein n=1 Tax=Aspergillus hiratsukae TaxID=1194566 RepID=A0A8H6P1R2_9EURO|nr:hypothetical protein CNMCM5793_002875 [Aspergillus hiratsukae]KAF7155965.1 hypothetical protein CNMCM6106_008401 [Aspergillus hiratsukae]
MQDLPRRSLRKARSGFLALRAGMQRRPLPGGHARRSDIPSIWSSRDSTEDSSDRFPSSVSDASTEDDHEFGTGLYRTTRNSSSSEALKDHHDPIPSTSPLRSTLGEGLEGTGLGSVIAAQEKTGVNGTSEAGVNGASKPTTVGSPREHATEPELDSHTPDGSSALVQTSTHALSDSPSVSLVEISRIEATTEHTASSETSKAASEKSPMNLQPSEDSMKDLCSQAQNSSPVLPHSPVINHEKPTAGSPDELLNPNVQELNESAQDIEIAPPQIASASTDSIACVYVSSRSPSRSSSVRSRESIVPQIAGFQWMMGTVEAFPSRQCSSGSQTLCCSDVAENDPIPRAIHHAPVDHLEDGNMPIETARQSRPSNARGMQVTHAGASTEPSQERSSAQEEETASCLLPALGDTDSPGIQNSSDPRIAQRSRFPSQAEDDTSDSDFVRSPIEIDDAIASLIFRDEFFFVDGKSSDTPPDRGDNPIKTGSRIARDGRIYSGPGLDRNMSVRTQEIPEIVGPGMYASRRSNLPSLERDASDSTDECIVTYPMWERRQFP